ncbi:WD40 repeat-like protein [Sodiomyces alkalinus F11]|uniref:Probable cytosolic iron-sulfur protein assembly protein 1 n=1 Tax=Sodiomyces alkalinus (strain CBS 110278 / VKM F-3762 / F11) TaxID=1314773 RepID=A0A3N2PKB1_SODAK|nr:WD40 repeat-like protein [Sodiomyces alkalinus F11]ROT34961.1 WD40 repeat-like protein [Sodiomyces alkalinus F11]
MPSTDATPVPAGDNPPLPLAVQLTALPPFKPDLYERAWSSIPHPTLPLLATTHGKTVTVFSLSTLSAHSTLTGGHSRSVRSACWKPNLPPHQLCLVTASFDATAALWRWDGELPFAAAAASSTDGPAEPTLETEVISPSARASRPSSFDPDPDSDTDRADDTNNSGDGSNNKDWEFTLVLEGHDSEIKSAVFSPSGAHLATCSRDQSVWIWEDIGASEHDDEWETVAVLTEHEGDVKSLAWCPDVPGRSVRRGVYGPDVLASASYDSTVRIWREDADGDWVCVAVLEGHEGTVWGVQWEPRPRSDSRFPRLVTYSADGTIRVWTLRQDEDDEEEEKEEKEENEEDGDGEDGRGNRRAAGAGRAGAVGGFGFGLGGIPNTMRRSLREEWYCSAILPAAHTRDVYSVTWSATTGLVASTGGDGVIAIYGEDDGAQGPDGDGDGKAKSEPGPGQWRVLTTIKNAHGPYEVNHITWCRRYDPGAERKGEEEMLVTTGDEGLVRPWQVTIPTTSTPI